jgi:hypothetical protein
MTQAADEIDRYYTSMLNWKASAEAKDRAPAPSKAAEGNIGDDAEFNRLMNAWDQAEPGTQAAGILYDALTAYIDSLISAARR